MSFIDQNSHMENDRKVRVDSHKKAMRERHCFRDIQVTFYASRTLPIFVFEAEKATTANYHITKGKRNPYPVERKAAKDQTPSPALSL